MCVQFCVRKDWCGLQVGFGRPRGELIVVTSVPACCNVRREVDMLHDKSQSYDFFSICKAHPILPGRIRLTVLGWSDCTPMPLLGKDVRCFSRLPGQQIQAWVCILLGKPMTRTWPRLARLVHVQPNSGRSGRGRPKPGRNQSTQPGPSWRRLPN